MGTSRRPSWRIIQVSRRPNRQSRSPLRHSAGRPGNVLHALGRRRVLASGCEEIDGKPQRIVVTVSSGGRTYVSKPVEPVNLTLGQGEQHDGTAAATRLNPDPGGANIQRYFDAPSGPINSHHSTRRPAHPRCRHRNGNVNDQARPSLRWPFVIMAIAGPPTAIVTFVLMQLAFGAADSAGSPTLLFQIVGFVLFLVWLASIAATIVGIVGAIVRSVRQR